jgi:hypothetical protein
MKKTQPVGRKLKKTDTADSRKHKRADSRRCRRVNSENTESCFGHDRLV